MNVQNLKDLINKLTEFGTNPKVKSENKILVLKKLLVEIYACYLNIESNQFEDFTEANLATGDAIDDLTDIINDMSKVKWYFAHTNSDEALWYFNFFMFGHSEQHLVDLLKYLKDLEE